MQAQVFYQAGQEAPAKPLVLVDNIDLVPEQDIPQVSAQGFSAKPGQVAYVDGAVYVGYESGCEKAAIAKAVPSLPEGHYSFESKLPTNAYVVWSLAQYAYDAFIPAKAPIKTLALPEELTDAVLAETSATFMVRDLINAPANHLGPEALAETVKQLAKTHKAKFQEVKGEALLKKNYPAIYAVGKGAQEAPRLAILTWGNKSHPKVSLVGKGVTFDSGGLDIKPSRGMRLMKKDMGGAAHMIGLAHWIMSLKLPIYLELYIPAVENAVSRDAYRPGDVITMRNGLTVEIDNTDAEGRLILADALAHACDNKPELLIDFATLTGAARIAVGTEITAMFCNQDAFAEGVLQASNEVEDPVWRMPLFQNYHALFKSKIADMANSSSSGYGGAITAALFLERFVTDDIPWMHCDLMAWNVTSSPGKPEGGEAMGIQSVMHYLKQRYSEPAAVK